MKTKRGFTWTCDGCAVIGNDISELKAVILQLKSEVADLKARSDKTKTPIVDEMLHRDETIIEEFQKRQNRQTNFILYGVKEE